MIHFSKRGIRYKSRLDTAFSLRSHSKSAVFYLSLEQGQLGAPFNLFEFYDYMGQHLFEIDFFEFPDFWSSGVWSILYMFCTFVEKFDTELCYAYATEMTVLH